MNRRSFAKLALAALGGAALWPAPPAARAVHATTGEVMQKIHKSETEWKAQLTPQQYDVLREKGTERAFSGEYDKFYKPGVYACAACDLELFSSATKFDSGTGWPSFYQPIDPAHVKLEDDYGFFMRRTEVLCARCEGHQGHVFEDGPPPTGLRYCINSVALKFIPAKKHTNPS